MGATVIIGGQWGDEGKAKVVDFLMGDHDVVVRFQGGANAGHTVVSGLGKFAFHQIPSGLLYPAVTGILGNGMVIDPFAFLQEYKDLSARGVDMTERLFVSSAAHVVTPVHKLMDNVLEADRRDASIGSTGKGIGPAYSDKHMRSGLRMGVFLREKDELFEIIERSIDWNNRIFAAYNAPTLSAETIASDFVGIKDAIEPFVVDTQEALHELQGKGRRILLEGAQGTLLDIDHGTYPFVTSSSCSIGGAVAGTGLRPRDIGRIVGIFKSYITRVGNGPMPSEIGGPDGEALRERGGEYGTTTGRPRRCGWFDMVAGRYSVQLNGYDEIALTKLDVLSGFSTVKICTGYRVGGRATAAFPQNADALARCEPVYEELPGWTERLSDARTVEELPAAARRFVERLEEGLGVPITFVSTGPAREETIIRSDTYSAVRK
ncbi:MAG: adenylosuccinate synthase [Candidatus Latescibacterota bacterium]|jgi:adenylosuccinate synthase|nr:MAG: adenylosuccinate synthase [Candidatus Latescibacterota bacterium]